ncbi:MULTISPECIES: hypothetical protein [unclassified Neorhizobium]|uniref:hypothetical protein n=1 Tax=unclassified Neorhizobium TaxID=2629175 RepID=UPI001FF41C60|nr:MULTISPECIES: hypothetical protein [unclassified Neorhizobium]MCJ9672150.1 hypothetical protein [Neorhizobium sp. SHOUNA12B]MCJ9748027.1 hypothetical protein [Neorhizobium sp. SHOUNA12A]
MYQAQTLPNVAAKLLRQEHPDYTVVDETSPSRMTIDKQPIICVNNRDGHDNLLKGHFSFATSAELEQQGVPCWGAVDLRSCRLSPIQGKWTIKGGIDMPITINGKELKFLELKPCPGPQPFDVRFGSGEQTTEEEQEAFENAVRHNGCNATNPGCVSEAIADFSEGIADAFVSPRESWMTMSAWFAILLTHIQVVMMVDGSSIGNTIEVRQQNLRKLRISGKPFSVAIATADFASRELKADTPLGNLLLP